MSPGDILYRAISRRVHSVSTNIHTLCICLFRNSLHITYIYLMGHTCINNPCTTLCDKVCQWLVAGLWFSPGTPVSSTNKTDRHDIAEIFLKVALNTINLTLYVCLYFYVISIRLWICSDSVGFFSSCKLMFTSDLYTKDSHFILRRII